MNPYQHSDVAVAIYRWLSEKAILKSQEEEGMVACGLAEMLAAHFDLELQPVTE